MNKLELVQQAILTNEPEETLQILYFQNDLKPAKHVNPLTKKVFHGNNIWKLEIEMILKGYNSCEWSTFAQYRDNKQSVNKGEHGTYLTLAVYNTVKNEKGEKEEIFQFFKGYTVFNKEQTSEKNVKSTVKETKTTLFDVTKYQVVA